MLSCLWLNEPMMLLKRLDSGANRLEHSIEIARSVKLGQYSRGIVGHGALDVDKAGEKH